MSNGPGTGQARSKRLGPVRGSVPTSWENFDYSLLGSGPLYFYVGAGLSTAAGLVNWSEMACMVWWYLKNYEREEHPARCPPNKGPKNAQFLQDFVRQTDAKGHRILSHESTDPRALGRTVLLNLMLRYRAPRIPLQRRNGKARPDASAGPRARGGREPDAEDLMLQSLIWRSRCSGVLTTNYDMLLEHAYSLFDFGPALHSYRYGAEFLRYLLSNPRFVLKLHGDINDIGSMELDPESAWERRGRLRSGGRKGRGADLKRVYSAILRQAHMVYVGCGFRDRTISELHAASRHESRTPSTCRIALLPSREVSSRLRREFPDINLLTFSAGWHEVREFLERVVGARSESPEEWRPCPEASDIYHQFFRDLSDKPPVQHLETKSWSCWAVEPR